MKRLILALVMVVMVSPAWGQEQTIGDFIKDQDKRHSQTIISSIYIGMLTVNEMLGLQNQGKLFCVPLKLQLLPEQLFHILTIEADSNDLVYPFSGQEIAAILFKGIVETFPCE
jgi:hypothetical protein